MPADLYYNLVILIGRLVPGHHHICTGHVLQIVYLQSQQLNELDEKTTSRKKLDHFKLNVASFWWGIVQHKGSDQWIYVLLYRFSTLPNDSSSSSGGNLDVSLQLYLFLGSKEILFLQFAKDTTLSLQPDMMEDRLPTLHLRNRTFSRRKANKTFPTWLSGATCIHIKKYPVSKISNLAADVL